MKDILIVLSRKDQPELVCAVLAHHGITATLAEDVQNAVLSMESHINAFLLLDLDLEGADSFLELVVSSFCQRRYEIVRKRRRNFVVFRRQGGDKIKRFLAQKECSRFAVSDA